MMSRAVAAALLAFAVAVPLAAQAPEGLMMRVDRSNNPQDPDDVPEVSITAVGDGLQVGTGPAVTLWKEDQRATGSYTLSGRFTLLEPSSHRNYYGLVFGGRNLNSENQWYLYFMVAQTGHFVVINRIDNANTNYLVSHTEHSAVQRPGSDGRSVNELAVRVGEDRIEFVVNGTVVHATEPSGPLLDTNGIYGVRVNHVLPGVLVEELEVTPM
ncbi:MAG TPA: hypothetical protein VLA09_02055 [Longimicrobiales bacterium]|nr:hypothetical protein [Longimicrobiales bacterium]